MRESDKEQILIFILRSSLYIGEVNQERIVAFIAGYEIGRGNKCGFTVGLIKHLKEKHLIPYRALGWPFKVQQVANKRRISWVSSFKAVSLELLNQCPSQEFGKIVNQHVRASVRNKVNAPEYHFGRNWIEDWIGICDLRQKWFQQLWNEEEWKLLIRLNTVVLNIERESKVPTSTARLLLLSKRLREKIDKNAT